MYGGHENDKKAREKKHMTFLEAAALAKEAKVARLWLTHYSPSIGRPEDYLEEVSEVFSESWAGKDGKTTTLIFDQSE